MSEELFAVGGYQVRRLDPARDESIVQALHERCADYMRIVEGRRPGPNVGREFLRAAPAGWQSDDVDKLGIFEEGGQLVGVLDSVCGYPEPDATHLGLMMLDPSIRCRGLGARLYRAFEAWAASFGAQRIRLSVVADNEAVHRFWRRLGFTHVQTMPPKQMGDKVQGVFVMERPVVGGQGFPHGSVGWSRLSSRLPATTREARPDQTDRISIGQSLRVFWLSRVGIWLTLHDGWWVLQRAWWLSIFPGTLLVLTVLSLNLLGDGLRDALDPRARQR